MTSKAKTTKLRGRPPKYVLDDEGKEIVGLSYNPTNGMFYATGTKPRHYFNLGYASYKKQEAIRQFLEWKKSTDYTPKEVEEQRQRNEIHQKAVQLIKDGMFDAEIEKKARELISDDYYVKEELLERAQKLLLDVHSVPDHPERRYEKGDFERQIKSVIEKEAQKYAEKSINLGVYDKDIWERAYDLIERDPILAAKILGIKEIIYADAEYPLPLKFDTAWRVFYCYRDKGSFLCPSKNYYAVGQKMRWIIGSLFLHEIKYVEFSDALLSYPSSKTKDEVLLAPENIHRQLMEDKKKEMIALMDTYTAIPMADRLQILEDVFTTVKKVGHDQADHILKLIKEFASNHS